MYDEDGQLLKGIPKQKYLELKESGDIGHMKYILCPHCEVAKLWVYFSLNRSKKNGKRTACRPCDSALVKMRRRSSAR